MSDVSQNNQSAGNRPDCEAIAPLLDCYHDNELDDAEKLQVEKHLVNCSACTAELADIARLVDRLKGLPAVTSSVDFADRVEKQILAARGNKVVSISSPRRWLAPLTAAAAVVALVLLGIQMADGVHNRMSVASSENSEQREIAASRAQMENKNESAVIEVNQKQNLVAISNPVQSNISEELGITTDEDGLYAIKM